MFRRCIVSTAIALFIVIAAAPASAATIQDLANGSVPSPFLVVSATHDAMSGYVVVDWKAANVPTGLAPVDVYIFFKAMDSSGVGDRVYFFTLNLFALIQSGGDWTQAIQLSTSAAPFVSALDISSFAAASPDVPVPGIIVDSSLIPDFYTASYVIYSALADSGTGEIIAQDLDLVRTYGMGGGDDEYDPCDTNFDGEVDDFEQNQCQNQNGGPNWDDWDCDINGDGMVDPFEEELCEALDDEGENELDCDLNGDGEITIEETFECVANQMGDDEGDLECDFNGDGEIAPLEEALCGM